MSLRANGTSATGRDVRLNVAVRPSWGATERHGLAGAMQFHLQRAHRTRHRAVDPACQPARQDVQCGLRLQARDQGGLDRLTGGGSSMAEASKARQYVMRLHEMSVSPEEYPGSLP